MRFRSSILHACAMALALAVPAAGQQPPAALLNELELAQLVERAEPADHARLSAHFAAVEARYRAEAARHTSMTKSLAAFASKQPAMPAHCERLASLNTRIADEARDLAAHHSEAARGGTTTAPADGAGLARGTGARTPTADELAAFASKATAAGDHQLLAEYFSAVAQKYTAEADRHAAIAKSYRGTKAASAAAHCERLVRAARASADEAKAAADMHRQAASKR